jgi:predicted RNA-binding Zn-ribbon protein involved in translation (DUF1610 family)
MRHLYCPICASVLEQNASGFKCPKGRWMESKLGFSIRRAVYGVDESKQPPRKAPELAPYLWCPSCTAELDVFDERGRELRCPACGLSLPAITQLDLLEFKKHHGKPDEDDWRW